MLQVKTFTGTTPEDIEDAANAWLSSLDRAAQVRVRHMSFTDVAQVTARAGMQRCTLLLVCETGPPQQTPG